MKKKRLFLTYGANASITVNTQDRVISKLRSPFHPVLGVPVVSPLSRPRISSLSPASLGRKKKNPEEERESVRLRIAKHTLVIHHVTNPPYRRTAILNGGKVEDQYLKLFY